MTPRPFRLSGILCSLVLLAAVTAAQSPLTVDEVMQQRYQLATAPLEKRSFADGLDAYGTVLDPSALLREWRDWKNARLEADLAEREAARTRKLAQSGQLASAHAVESAETAAQLAVAQVEARAETLELDWGPIAAELLGAGNDAWAADLRSGGAVLVRLSLPVGQALPPELAGALVWPVNAPGGAMASARLWPDRHASAQAAPGFVALLRPSEGSWPVGLAVQARLDRAAPARNGYRVPSAAVVYAAGAAWIYQQTGADSFTRVAVATDFPDGEGGWIVPETALAGDQPIVVHGAQALWAEETLRSMGGAEDE